MESRAVQRLRTRYYVAKDLILSFALSLPIYSLLLMRCADGMWPAGGASLAVVFVHAVATCWLLSKPIKERTPEDFTDREG